MSTLETIRRLRNQERREPIVDMNEMANRLDVPPLKEGPDAYAPPERRKEQLMDLAVETVDTFGALPTKELDDAIDAAKKEIAAIEADAQRIRNEYVNRVEELKRNIKRLMEGCALAKKTFDELSKQIEALDDTPEMRHEKD